MSMQYKLDSFEGPLDLLLHLIDQAEIDIQDISISDITDQYMDYLQAMQQLELELTSEFLVMAATLLAMKSNQLLPKPPVIDQDAFAEWAEGDLDPRDELIQKLIEYRKFKQLAEQLRDKESERSLIYDKEPEDLTPYERVVPLNPLHGVYLSDLIQAFQKAMRRATRRDMVATVHRDEISVKDRIQDIIHILRQHETIRFSRLLSSNMIRQEIVVTFLAILELMKMKRIRCFQHQLFEDIVIEWKGETQEDELSELEVNY
ncbi:segregation and condensation protein A [Paenibacillus yanchengensis]|uniref:Segregation and condensation protein A n=1 Tax=Paenibacillus yanchengensis TaxID=2035833 RepID=A0ABW4YKI3_9BACL